MCLHATGKANTATTSRRQAHNNTRVALSRRWLPAGFWLEWLMKTAVIHLENIFNILILRLYSRTNTPHNPRVSFCLITRVRGLAPASLAYSAANINIGIPLCAAAVRERGIIR